MTKSPADTRPLVAIVGSARSDISGSKEKAARQACEDLGRALARAGWRIAVYSDDEVFIEPHLVRGYVAEGGAGEHSIVCYYPQGAGIAFPERSQHRELFTDRMDATSDWEVSFYRSLSDTNGILILGGASSTLIAGHISMTRHLPSVAVAEFGGAGTKLWSYMKLKPDGVESSGGCGSDLRRVSSPQTANAASASDSWQT